jgi:hypothetical protein
VETDRGIVSLIDHLERSLGKISGGWNLPGKDGALQVVRFLDQPNVGVSTYVTLGVSRAVLPLGNGREVRQELLISAHDEFDPEQVASFLLTFSEYFLNQRRALLRGDVVGPSSPLIPGAEVVAVYASLPTMFGDEFWTFSGSTPPTVLVWLIPVHDEEVAFIKANGWSAFEDLLEARNPDLCDLRRCTVA